MSRDIECHWRWDRLYFLKKISKLFAKLEAKARRSLLPSFIENRPNIFFFESSVPLAAGKQVIPHT